MKHAVTQALCVGSRVLAPVLVVVIFSGCGSNGVTKVEGTVKYQGIPLQHGRVGFIPQQGRPAFGDIEQGRFVLTTYEPGDGALPGHHRVTVQCDKPADPNDAFSDRIPTIPGRYFQPETSGLTADVEPGKTNHFDFQLTDQQP